MFWGARTHSRAATYSRRVKFGRARYRRLIESVSEDGSLIKETKQQTILNLLAEEQQRQKGAGDRI